MSYSEFVFGCSFLFFLGGLSAFCRARLGRWVCLVSSALSSLGAFYHVMNHGLTMEGSGHFLLSIGLVGFASAWHAGGYLAGESVPRRRFFWLFFNWTMSSMLLVLHASTAMRFLVAWELMGLFSFALVLFEHHEDSVRHGSWLYLLACEAGGLLLMLALFPQWSGMSSQWCAGSAIPYLLLVGFGLKAGFPLLHFWLPEAHPAAPAPVSAVMSGAMIPLGFYGLLHFMPGVPSGLFAVILLTLGLIGAFCGILSALCCTNLKRLLAYSSIENMGIIAMGIGLGFLGMRIHHGLMISCGIFGAMLHIINHALLKGSLFLGAGTVLKSTGTLNMDRLGGLMEKMPVTGSCFTLSSLGICGLPPFCGFTSELLLYVAGFAGLNSSNRPVVVLSLLSILVLGLTGAVAAAAFAKFLGVVFLGEARYEEGRNALNETRSMSFPICFLSMLAILLPFVYPAVLPELPWRVLIILIKYGMLCFGFYLIVCVLFFIRRRVGTDSRRELGTWDCGYAKPTARMQYTGSAFVQPLADLFASYLKQKKTVEYPNGYFPRQASISVCFQDVCMRCVYLPVVRVLQYIAIKAHRFQLGYVQFYILILLLALLLLLGYGFHEELLAQGWGVR